MGCVGGAGCRLEGRMVKGEGTGGETAVEEGGLFVLE